MMKYFTFSLFLMCFMVLTSGCCYPVRYDGPYKGKVVDAETGQPIEGVVILGAWYKEIATAAGGVSSFYDAAETVSDRNGEFEIRGLGLKILTNIGPMHVLIFKSGYQQIGMGLWESLSLDGGLLMKKVTWEGNRAIILLKKVTIAQRKKDPLYPPMPPSEASLGKVRLMLMEINKDLKNCGFEPITVWGGERI